MTQPAPAAAAPASEPILLRRDRDGVATLTLNRPAARNALSNALMGALQEAIEAIAEDERIRVVVIAGAGPAFCAGHDLREIRARAADGRDAERKFYEALFRRCSHLMMAITRLPKPVIAKVHGIATAAGCQLVAACDLAIAGDQARFATPGVNIGLFCSTPMVALSRAVGRKPAMEMLLTGDLIPAERALAIGLVNRVVPQDRLDAETDALARQIAGKSPLTLAIGKEAFYRQAELDLQAAYDYATEVMTRNMLARDAAEGIDAFLEKPDAPMDGSMNHDHYSDAYLRDTLGLVKTIAVVGASPKEMRPSYFAMKIFRGKGFRMIPINPGFAGRPILDETTYASLKDLPEPVDMVDIFRNADAAAAIVDEALALPTPPKVIWMQFNVRNDAAAAKAEAAGVRVVMNRCPKVEWARLNGELGWQGIDSRMISSKKRKL